MNPIYIWGDTHGKWSQMFAKIKEYDISNCHILHVGDIGIGFSEEADEIKEFMLLNDYFAARQIIFMGIRGNHDSPEYFNGDYIYPYFQLIPDYHQEEINGRLFLFIGGAISIDRKLRKIGEDYWQDEGIKSSCLGHIDYSGPKSPDIIISHDCPLEVGFSPEFLYDEPGNPVKTDAIKGRQILSDIFGQFKGETPPKKWFYGHYHSNQMESILGTDFHMMGINSIYELRF